MAHPNINDNQALAGKTVFITGAGSGLGAALGEVLARSGSDIVVADLDAATLQDPVNVAQAIRSVLLMPEGSVVAEISVLPLQESSLP